mmetsp:Transcript_17543/g.35937  ORF Transcript_17543/g.35937 Transcript_17543/m.35937 type:complete len:232 (-) Transcript_17543:916-1611(-)
MRADHASGPRCCDAQAASRNDRRNARQGWSVWGGRSHQGLDFASIGCARRAGRVGGGSKQQEGPEATRGRRHHLRGARACAQVCVRAVLAARASDHNQAARRQNSRGARAGRDFAARHHGQRQRPRARGGVEDGVPAAGDGRHRVAGEDRVPGGDRQESHEHAETDGEDSSHPGAGGDHDAVRHQAGGAGGGEESAHDDRERADHEPRNEGHGPVVDRGHPLSSLRDQGLH